jgi:hypothetical protein
VGAKVLLAPLSSETVAKRCCLDKVYRQGSRQRAWRHGFCSRLNPRFTKRRQKEKLIPESTWILLLRFMTKLFLFHSFSACLLLLDSSLYQAVAAPALHFRASNADDARTWQQEARRKLFSLMMGGTEPARVGLDAKIQRQIPVQGASYMLEETSLQTLPDRRARVWVGRPVSPKGKVGVVLALNGHGGSGEQIVHGQGLYWYGRALLEMGYLVVAPDIGQHELQHTNWCLMGERTWDALRSLDYALSLPEADSKRVAVAGLSLGGETTMYVAALDERVQLACSSGWLTTVANMKNGHCPCFNFQGLEENFDFSDIFACVAPRGLVCELGEQERAPGGFPVAIGREAVERIQAAYRVFGADTAVKLTVHPGPHVFSGTDFFPQLAALLGAPGRPLPDAKATVAWSKFVDGPEALDGTPYFWLGRNDLAITFRVPPEPGDALELGWGAKGDVRDAAVTVNGTPIRVSDGGHWGFRWVRLPLPQVTGNDYSIAFTRGSGQPAFLSEVRLVRLRGQNTPPALDRAFQNAVLRVTSVGASIQGEAFPEMRRAWDTRSEPPIKIKSGSERALLQQAEQNARTANEALFRCQRYVHGWLAHADPVTGLIPRNFRESRDFWNGRDSAADNYPFMVLTAAFTERDLLQGRLLEMLRTETKLTSRVGGLPDDYSFSKRGWRREKLDLDEIIFDGAEYVKDGLLPITELLGPTPWSERMVGILDDIWAEARVETPSGKIPTLNAEVLGDLLQACSRVYWFTGDAKYLDWGCRLGDYFLLGTNHPTRNERQLRLVDHGCEIVNGLSELYLAVSRVRPEKKRAWQEPLHDLFDCILEKGRNEDGLLYSWFNPKTGEHSPDLCDTWGYDFDGFYTMWLVDGTEPYRAAVQKGLSNLKGKYVGACWGDKSADGFADSIEGALNLLNRETSPGALDWIESQTRLMWSIQKPDGVVEGWHGDGNFARTTLMYAFWKTQGLSVESWRPDLFLGAVRDGQKVRAVLYTTGEPWKGRLRFDTPRHKGFMHLPLDYPRINQFPEWFTAKPGLLYQVKLGGKSVKKAGGELAAGLEVKLRPGEWLIVEAKPQK